MLTVRLSSPDDIGAYCEFLRAVHVRVESVNGTLVSASVVGAPSPLHERRELTGYVTTWNALNPSRTATICD